MAPAHLQVWESALEGGGPANASLGEDLHRLRRVAEAGFATSDLDDELQARFEWGLCCLLEGLGAMLEERTRS